MDDEIIKTDIDDDDDDMTNPYNVESGSDDIDKELDEEDQWHWNV